MLPTIRHVEAPQMRIFTSLGFGVCLSRNAPESSEFEVFFTLKNKVRYTLNPPSKKEQPLLQIRSQFLSLRVASQPHKNRRLRRCSRMMMMP
jgi:hypothetical protein